MADEIRMSAQLNVEKGYFKLDRSVQRFPIDMTGTNVTEQVQAIGTTHEALTIGSDIGTAGIAWFRNLDTTNYVEIGVDVAATFYGVIKLGPGEFCCCGVSTKSLYARANTAAVDLEFKILEA